ncbi:MULTISPECIES: CoA transferase [unclassified Streptomyces]|uniref:CoA transferase n=1 Tax=unclassified Streptomyces TaxID=2593676 RepID=UPI0005AADB1B|nr:MULTISPECIES: CoA transferase [unclassified Streptomyces]ODA72883.1 E-cinnamoyl-CoA:R-phenyllactate CoA transferase [Streptomyces sp. AVP053U2]WAX77949.1 CoA transferase [Streptomyces sp. KMM 9044]
MATPATPAVARTVGPLDGLRLESSGPPGPADGLVAEHLRLLGARGDGSSGSRLTVTGEDLGEVTARTTWGMTATDEATAQAATGIMAVHGRRDGSPRGLAVDYAATATGVLAVQGLLAGLLASARGGGRTAQVEVSAERAGLLAASQYLAAAGAEEGEAAELAPGGPPFTSADGTVFELETLDPGVWAAFWRALDAPEEAIRQGWRPFQFRYATACAPFPRTLHEAVRASSWERVRHTAETSGADVCPLRSLAERAAEYDGAPPWELSPRDATYAPGRASGDPPLSGFTVLEAGRRVQAPLAAHLLGLLGAEVIRIEPPGGDPLRGMPPTCSGVSARWLALNRGKKAVEVDIKSPADRERLREMAADADVFLHNWAPGKAAQLGLDHEHLAAANPALVYAYTSGWAGRLPGAPMGTDFMVQARTGVGEAVRPADETPAPSLMTLLDVLGGLLGTEGVLAGLLLRERTGHGVRVDSSLLGAADVLTAPARARAAQGLDPRQPAGFRRPLPTTDGWIALPDHGAIPYDVRGLSTGQALLRLRERGLAAVPVVTDLALLLSSGSISRDAHGAPAVPTPWSFV